MASGQPKHNGQVTDGGPTSDMRLRGIDGVREGVGGGRRRDDGPGQPYRMRGLRAAIRACSSSGEMSA